MVAAVVTGLVAVVASVVAVVVAVVVVSVVVEVGSSGGGLVVEVGPLLVHPRQLLI